jgi:hypothetical protein
MRRVLLVRGCWKTVKALRKFKIQDSKFKIQTRPDSREAGERRSDSHPAAATPKCLRFEF